MKMKKLISALVVAAQVFTLSVVPSITAQAEATTNLGLVYYQEAETATDWTVTRGSAAAEADADGISCVVCTKDFVNLDRHQHKQKHQALFAKTFETVGTVVGAGFCFVALVKY